MKEIYININSSKDYSVGRQFDHNAYCLVFDVDSSDYYLQLQNSEYTYEAIPIPDKIFPITSTYTQTYGSYVCQLMRKTEDGTLVQQGTQFRILIEKSLGGGEGIKEVVPPNFQTAYDKMVDTQQRVVDSLENGEFIPNLFVGEVRTLEPDEPVEVTFEGRKNVTVNFGIPKGRPGDGYDDTEVRQLISSETNRAIARENEIEAKIPSHDNFATKQELQEEINSRTSEDSAIREDVNQLLNNKADKSSTYTKSEVDNKISQATPTDYESVKLQVQTNKDNISNLTTNKQNNIPDLETIRQNALKGSTAVQDVNYVHTDANFTIEEKNKLDGILNDEEVKEGSTWSSQKIANRLNDIELAKFPNVTIIGQPTIQQGQISNFSATNYCQFPFIVDFQNQPFVLDFEITTGAEVTQQHNVFDSIFGLAFAVRNSKFVVAISTNGTSWNMGEGVGTYTVLPNSTYRVKMEWNKTNFIVSYSTDGGTTYIADITKSLTVQPYPKQMFIGVTSDKTTTFNGSINLNYATLSIANKIVWQGMDDVGLATRMAVDMSNIDIAGINKIKEITDVGLSVIDGVLCITYEED